VNATQVNPWADIPTTPQPKMMARFFDGRGVFNHEKVGPAEEVLDEIRLFAENMGTDPDCGGADATGGKIKFCRVESPGYILRLQESCWGAQEGDYIRLIVGPDPDWIGVEKKSEPEADFTRWILLSKPDTLDSMGWFQGKGDEAPQMVLSLLIRLGHVAETFIDGPNEETITLYCFTPRGRGILLRGE
jgi:hypothetical protein